MVDRFVLIASCLTRSLLIIPRLFICAEIARSRAGEMFFPLLSVGVKAGPPRSTSRGDSSRQRPLLVLLRGVKHSRRSEKDEKNTRHSTVYGSRLNRSERKKGDRDKTKGLAWNLYRREGRGSGSKQRDQGNTRQRQESPEPESRLVEKRP